MFHEMKQVYAVYQEMSFSKAAKNLYISQPSLSAAVRKEENELGFPIFDRSTTPIRLTDFGKEYIRAAERIMDIERSFSQYIDDLSGLKTGTLTIGASNLFISYLLPPLLSAYRKRYPSVTVDLVEGNADTLTEKLLTGKIDLLIDNIALDSAVYDSKFCSIDRLMLTVPKKLRVNEGLESYALTARQIRDGAHTDEKIPAVPLECFRKEPFLLLKAGNDSRIRAEAICAAHGFHLKPQLEFDQQITAYNLSCYGLGISFCGDLLIRMVPPCDDVLFYKLDEETSVRSIRCYYKHSRYLTKAAQEFLKMI